LVALVLAALWFGGRTVQGDDMAPSIADGDRVWAWKTDALLPGDVVLLPDPMDPAVVVMRRVLAVEGQSIGIRENTIRVGKRRLRSNAMGDMGEYLVAKEILWEKKPKVGADWLTRIPATPSNLWSSDAVEVPEGHVYLMADDRARAVDSRWWGPVPVDFIRSTVRMRWGPEHAWRTKFEWMVGTVPIGE
jgi:signal peptidase I